MTITLDLPDDLAARLAARPDAEQFVTSVLTDALTNEENASLLDRINAAYASEQDSFDEEERERVAQMRRQQRKVVGREAW